MFSLVFLLTFSTLSDRHNIYPAAVCTEDQDAKIASFIKARLMWKVYFSEISKMKRLGSIVSDFTCS